jgi:hypothetical protein
MPNDFDDDEEHLLTKRSYILHGAVFFFGVAVAVALGWFFR